jgi:hypothetical protein
VGKTIDLTGCCCCCCTGNVPEWIKLNISGSGDFPAGCIDERTLWWRGPNAGSEVYIDDPGGSGLDGCYWSCTGTQFAGHLLWVQYADGCLLEGRFHCEGCYVVESEDYGQTDGSAPCVPGQLTVTDWNTDPPENCPIGEIQTIDVEIIEIGPLVTDWDSWSQGGTGCSDPT